MNTDEFKYLIPGFVQGITRVSISYPFDVIKVNMQKRIFPSMHSTFMYLLKNDSKRFYRGSLLSYTSVGLERSLQYYYNEKLNKYKYNPYIISFCSSCCTSLISVPIQFITTNIAIRSVSLSTYLKTAFSDKLNIYKGFSIELFRSVLGSTIFGGTYFYLRNYFGENIALYPLYGACSGIVSWIIIFPIDTIRTEYQTTSSKNISSLIWNFNPRYIYFGITPVLLRTVPSASAGMYTYELTRKYINELK